MSFIFLFFTKSGYFFSTSAIILAWLVADWTLFSFPSGPNENRTFLAGGVTAVSGAGGDVLRHGLRVGGGGGVGGAGVETGSSSLL